MNKTEPSYSLRYTAAALLERVETGQAFSHLLLHHELAGKAWSREDAGLLTEIVYGTLRRQNTLDYMLGVFVNKPLTKLDAWVRVLLRMSVYQMRYLDRVPDHAVVDEAVKIAKQRGNKGVSGFVNGVLRSLQRKGFPDTSAIKNAEERLAVDYSHPAWMLKEWQNAYGEQTALRIAEANNVTPKTSVRVSPEAELEDVQEMLEQEGIQTTRGAIAEKALIVEKGNVLVTEAYQNGYITVQDESSMKAGEALKVEESMDILDACAAPGGKSTDLAERTGPGGSVTAHDLSAKKLNQIEEQAARLQLENIATAAGDARQLTTTFPARTFDRVLVDAPCSGLGVIRKKPEQKWAKKVEDFERLPEIQQEILNEAVSMLRFNGRIVYSTCTIRPEENEQVWEAFLHRHPELTPDHELTDKLNISEIEHFSSEYGWCTILPHEYGTDGFFIAAAVKNNQEETEGA
ncbi:16S rRNA (cytosine(967)-C(5))-methyltransferase RsmB [uncultured Marinococcus sp.]|uniref:16S rRNA (cytosine(967)-C(5))-methyltransferase RsmB n=1 Tax=uncultured Marinococcus sp. TaxID=487012 RepID=UPI00260E5F6F|nr:16S rRNA (cytosine(967)-C(5))-methyltransferase RsmB [uncultured Marinococcus sp.]